MTHTQVIALILDATRNTGVLFHLLPADTRKVVATAGKAYALAHATGDVDGRKKAEYIIRYALNR